MAAINNLRHVDTISIGIIVFLLLVVFLQFFLHNKWRVQGSASGDRIAFLSNEVWAYKGLFMNAGILMAIASFNGKFLNANPRLLTALGYTGKEFIGHQFINFVHPDDKKKTGEAMVRLNQGLNVLEFENRYRKADGVYVCIQWNCRVSGDLIYCDGKIFDNESECKKN